MRLYLFDVSNIFYRSFYGNERLATSYGFPTQGLHGFIRMVHSIMRDHQPDLVAFAMEGGGESQRKKLDPTYKANRQQPPEDLIMQLKVLPELMSVMGYPTFKFEGYEADDTIATLTTKGLQQGLEVVIVSSDKDFCQLLQPGIKMYNLSKSEMVDDVGVATRYGIMPNQFLDYLSIVGDTSDNIKGVKGIGEKGAMELIKVHGSLDGIYRDIQFIKGAKKDKLVAGRQDVYKAQAMIRFMDVPVGDVQFGSWCRYGGPRVDEARTFFRRYEFREIEQMILPTGTVNVGGVDIGVRK